MRRARGGRSIFLVLMAGSLMLAQATTCSKPGPLSRERSIRVAVCQIVSLDGDREGNITRIENALVEAKDGGAEIACFPETALLGWVNPDAHERAFPIPGPDSERLCELAAALGIHLVIGLAEKEGESLYDSVLLIDDEGKLLMKHRKINILSELMTPPYTPGREVGVADTRFGRIGLLICADTFQDEILDRMAVLEPDLVVVPYGWAAREEQWPEHGRELLETVTRAASRIRAPLVGTDLVGEITHGPWTGLTYGGQSVVSDGAGKVLARGADRDREVLVLDIPLPDSH
jgi:predicted amidohydrolase